MLQSLSADQLTALHARRKRLTRLVDFPVLLWSGGSPSRNFPANRYPFRASSHFLFFAGIPIVNAVIRLEGDKLELFVDEPGPGSALWHGPEPGRDELAEMIGAEAAFPLSALAEKAEGAATVAVQSPNAGQHQAEVLGRVVAIATQAQGIDGQLVRAIVQTRLTQDEAGLEEMRRAADVSVAAHEFGMVATAHAETEAEVRSAMEGVLLGHNMTTAYNSIVTVHGEVLHNEVYHHFLQPTDLLLADVGAETQSGWAADITRTWPVSGKFSSTQRDIYNVVLAAHDACIEAVKPGKEYQEIHLLACEKIAAGLVDLGILKGKAEDLVAQDAHALFFPHGVGHLLGLDVHDMEDLGDLAGYEEGRERSDRFGLGYLRLNRPLQAGMVVTIEPGFYQVPALLNDSAMREKYSDAVNWERLADFADVRGIRIEDDVLVTDAGAEVLTAALPCEVEAIEALVGAA